MGSFLGVFGKVQGVIEHMNADPADESGEACFHGQDGEAARRRFLCQLAVALMTYGSSVPRAQYLVTQAAARLTVEINIAVLPAYVIIIFPITDADSARNDTHLLAFEVDVDLAKLQQTDELCNSVGLRETPLQVADQQLRLIVVTQSPFGKWWELFGYSVSAATATLLFFSGNLWDAAFSLVLGFLVGLLAMNSVKLPALTGVFEFLSALLVSLSARIISVYFRDLGVCYFAMALSALVWRLPGQTLTVGISEVVQNSILPGASRIVRSLVVALQMGFGLVVGEKLAWWCKESPFQKTCSSSGLSEWWGILWFLGYAVATNVLLKASLRQWFAMILASGVGALVDNYISPNLGTETSAVISAFSIGITGTLVGYASKEVPLSITFAGIQVLLPGGIGVQGVEAFMEDDVLSGIQFVMSMVSICLSITLGLLLSKVAIRDAVLPHRMLKKDVLSFEETRRQNEEEENEQFAV